MFCNEKLKLNKFRPVAIPKNVQYIQRYGKSLPVGGAYSGEEPAPQAMRKVDMLADMEAYDAMKQREESES